MNREYVNKVKELRRKEAELHEEQDKLAAECDHKYPNGKKATVQYVDGRSCQVCFRWMGD